MKKKLVLMFAALLSATVLFTGCTTTQQQPSEQPSSSETSSSENASGTDIAGEESVFSDEENAYREWKQLETEQPAFDKTGASVEPDELLKRAVMVENFLQDYPESAYRDEAVSYYNKLLVAAVTGGYTGEENANHLYLDEDGKMIREDVVGIYETFLRDNAGTKTANIIEEYVTLLGTEERGFTDAVKNFYVDITERMKNMFETGLNTMENGVEDIIETVPENTSETSSEKTTNKPQQ